MRHTSITGHAGSLATEINAPEFASLTTDHREKFTAFADAIDFTLWSGVAPCRCLADC